MTPNFYWFIARSSKIMNNCKKPHVKILSHSRNKSVLVYGWWRHFCREIRKRWEFPLFFTYKWKDIKLFPWLFFHLSPQKFAHLWKKTPRNSKIGSELWKRGTSASFWPPAWCHQNQIWGKREQLSISWNKNDMNMKTCAQSKYRAENSKLKVIFGYLEYLTPGMTSSRPNMGEKCKKCKLLHINIIIWRNRTKEMNN